MLKHYILINDEPKEVSLEEYIHYCRIRPDNRLIQTNVMNVITGRKMLISTVFLSIDHQYERGGQPLLFETMVFYDGSSHDQYCERYSTAAEARRRHSELVIKFTENN